MSALLSLLFFNRYTLFVAATLLYIVASPVIEGNTGIFRMELPLLLYLYFCLNRLTRPSFWQPLVTALPLAMLYMVHDFYLLRFSRIPKWWDFNQVPELLAVIDAPFALLLGFLLLLPVFLLLLHLQLSLPRLFWLLPLLPVFIAPFTAPHAFIEAFIKQSKQMIYYSAQVHVSLNGRLITSLYHEAKRLETLQQLGSYRNVEKLSMRLTPQHALQGNGKNVHLIIMESFLDPALFTRVSKELRLTPAHPDFQSQFAPYMGFSLSPIFGGYTAQPEFEVLCGVPAFQEFDSIEFNLFTGAKTYCLPSILRQFGYSSSASNAYKPEFFNTPAAYRGLDFDAIYFAKEYTPEAETYLVRGEEKADGDEFFFDGDLMEQNLAYVEKRLQEKKPFFNYLLTVYGHFTFELGSRAGPAMFRVPEVPEAVEKILNQHYYRTKALAHYLRRLMELDPSALIVVVSDHLPPLPGGKGDYGRLGYFPNDPEHLMLNRLLVIREGKAERYERFTHFNLYRLILDFVTDQGYCRQFSCQYAHPIDRESFREDYRTLIGLASAMKEDTDGTGR
ncbi:sulfatase-like hydrolase/transferase [Candidatus Magnetaquicoccus inordinatus]|uniref:sulfatase-like hydrolase/transferase n=1 Tax=Candidatus Magnetaquicoccus inordinatus TaxID=2496818 RepID=UPI00102CF192|nr:sulfatase-like hydrolase/transferase [Candidatus Magnetaquicoccus inordinatus]